MALTIYGVALSRANRNLWLAEELGLAYTHVETDFRPTAADHSRTEAFLAINPNGHVPAIDDDGLVMCESMAINLYLARKHGGALAPATLAEEAQTLMWTFWAVTEGEADALTLLLHHEAPATSKRRDAAAAKAIDRLRAPFAVLDAHLRDHGHVVGTRFTVADINLATVFEWVGPVPALLDRHRNVASWLSRCLARPASRKVQGMVRP